MQSKPVRVSFPRWPSRQPRRIYGPLAWAGNKYTAKASSPRPPPRTQADVATTSAGDGERYGEVARGEFKPDDPIFRGGWSVHSAPRRPAKLQPPLDPPPTDEEMGEQYSLQRQLERTLMGVK